MDLRVESPPARAVPVLRDDVVEVPLRVEVAGEADPAACGQSVLPQDPEREERVVTTATLESLFHSSLHVQR